MEWNSNLSSFVSSTTALSSSNSFFYSYNYNQFPVLAPASISGTNDQKHHQIITMADTEQALVYVPPPADHKIVGPSGGCNTNNNQEKKKRLTSEQLGLLERCFLEEMKLDPDRKLKLSRELGLQPRQIAVWFQNRRARWKNKHLEHLYESLRQDFDVVSREKQLLEEEVTKLKTILKESGSGKKQAQAAQTEILTEATETVESTSAAGCSSGQSQNPDNIHTGQMNLIGKEHNLEAMASLNYPVLLTYT